MAPLRDIAMLLAINDILLIPTKANQLADDLFRFKYRKIADDYPQLQQATSLLSRDKTHQNTGTRTPHYPEGPLVSSGGR